MNIKKILGISLVCTGAVLAQTAAPTPAAASAPAAPAQAAPAAQVQPAPAQNQAPAQAAPAQAAAPAPQAQTAESVQATPAAEPAAEPAPAPQADEPAKVETAPEQAAAPEAPKAEPAAEPAAETANVEEKKETPRGPGFTPRLKTKFDVLHGNAYNRQSNVAAANNVDLLLRYPNLFANQKFLYIEPSGEKGVVSFGNLFSALDISGDVGRITIGYATLGFGAYLKAGVGRVQLESEDATRYNTSFGDDLGLAISKTIVGYNVGLTVDWVTHADESSLEPKYGSSTDERFRDLTVNLNVTNSPRANNLFWTAGVRFVNNLDETEVDGEDNLGNVNLGGEGNSDGAEVGDVSNTEYPDSYMQFTPYLRLGYIGLKNEHARVIAGLGAMVPLTFHEDYEIPVGKNKTETRSLNEYTFLLEPQLLGEVFLTDNVMFFGEASYQWVAAAYQDGSNGTDDDYSVLVSQMDKVEASMGVRLQYQDFVACEFALGDSFFTDTKSIFNGEGVFISFGGFIYF